MYASTIAITCQPGSHSTMLVINELKPPHKTSKQLCKTNKPQHTCDNAPQHACCVFSTFVLSTCAGTEMRFIHVGCREQKPAWRLSSIGAKAQSQGPCPHMREKTETLSYCSQSCSIHSFPHSAAQDSRARPATSDDDQTCKNLAATHQTQRMAQTQGPKQD